MYVDPSFEIRDSTNSGDTFHQKLLRAPKECGPLLKRNLAHTIKKIYKSIFKSRYNIFMIPQETHPKTMIRTP